MLFSFTARICIRRNRSVFFLIYFACWQLVKEILEKHDQNKQNETNPEVDDGDVEVEIAEGDQVDDEDVEVEVAEGDQTDDKDVDVDVKENVEAEVQEDVELEIEDDVEVEEAQVHDVGLRCEGVRVDEVMRSQEEMQISYPDQVEVGTVLLKRTRS